MDRTRRPCRVVLPNRPKTASAFIRIAAAAVCAQLNRAYRESEFEFYLRELSAKIIVLPEERGESGHDPSARAARRLRLAVLRRHPDGRAAGLFTLADDGHIRPCASDSPYSLDSAQPEDSALVLHTSGTTGRRRLVPITRGNLTASVGMSRRALKITFYDRCLDAMPLFLIHRRVGATRLSLSGGGSLFCSPRFDATVFYDWLDAARPPWYIAVPSMHQPILTRAADYPEAIASNPLRLIRSARSPSDVQP